MPSLKDFGIAPHETYEAETQSKDDFVRGGLARVLEHTEEEVAKKLSRIFSMEPRVFRGYEENVRVLRGDLKKDSSLLSVVRLEIGGYESKLRVSISSTSCIGMSCGKPHYFGEYSGYLYGILEDREMVRKVIEKVQSEKLRRKIK